MLQDESKFMKRLNIFQQDAIIKIRNVTRRIDVSQTQSIQNDQTQIQLQSQLDPIQSQPEQLQSQPKPIQSLPPPRILDWRDYDTSNSHLIVLPTGTGKSYLIALAPFLVDRLYANEKIPEGVLIITPSSSISTQIEEIFGHKNGILNRMLDMNSSTLSHRWNMQSSSVHSQRNNSSYVLEGHRVYIWNAQKFTSNPTRRKAPFSLPGKYNRLHPLLISRLLFS